MKREPNEETKAAMREGRMISVIRDLLKHAVYDEAMSDDCIAAVKAARKIIKDATKPIAGLNK